MFLTYFKNEMQLRRKFIEILCQNFSKLKIEIEKHARYFLILEVYNWPSAYLTISIFHFFFSVLF